MKRAQSAMEYLMTYGWAILIVIIVAAALFALGVFNPATYTGRAATGFGELGSPADWQYASASDTLTLVLKNQVGQDISVTNVTSTGCTQNQTTTTVSAGGTGTFTLASCPDKNAGASFSQPVTVSYIVAGSTLSRTATGTVTGSAV